MADIFISASISASASLSCALSCSYALVMSPTATADASLDVGGPTSVELATLQPKATATCGLDSINSTISLDTITSTVSASIAELTQGVTIVADITATATASLDVSGTFIINPEPLTVTAAATLSPCPTYVGVCDVIKESLLLWGIESPCLATQWVQSRAITDLNAAMQILWSRTETADYWTRTTLSLEFSAGQESIKLKDEIQNVVGTATIERAPLAILRSRGEFDNYSIYYQGASSRAVANSVPEAYYIERLSQEANDPCMTILHLAPKPAVSTEVKLDVVLEAPHYTWCDFDDCTRIPIPHQYIESILMPIVRYRASSFHLFIEPERREIIRNEYLEALAQLGINDPLPGKEESDE